MERQVHVNDFFGSEGNANVRNAFASHLQSIEASYGVDAFKWFVDEKAPNQKISGRLYYNVDGKEAGSVPLKSDFKMMGTLISAELTEHLAGSIRKDSSDENLARLYEEVAASFKGEISGIVDRFMQTDYGKSHPGARDVLTDFLSNQTSFSLIEVAMRNYAAQHKDEKTQAKIYDLNKQLTAIDTQHLIANKMQDRPLTAAQEVQKNAIRAEIQQVKEATNYFDLNQKMIVLRTFTKDYAPNVDAGLERKRQVDLEKSRAGAKAKISDDVKAQWGDSPKLGARVAEHWKPEGVEEVTKARGSKSDTSDLTSKSKQATPAMGDTTPKTSPLSRLFKKKEPGESTKDAAKRFSATLAANGEPAQAQAEAPKFINNPLSTPAPSGETPDSPRSSSPGSVKK